MSKFTRSTYPLLCLIMLVAFTLLPFSVKVQAAAQGGVLVMQQNDPSAPNYFSGRRALVGRYCTVNRIGSGIGVGSGMKDLQNITNDDLSDCAVLPAVLNADVAVKQYVSVKDTRHHYAAGTQAGFVLSAKGSGNLLKLDLVKFYSIRFYLNGESVGLVGVNDGRALAMLELALASFPGDDEVNYTFTAVAPAEFDEIALEQDGIEATAATAIRIKYAFVGKADLYTLTAEGEGNDDAKSGMPSYQKYLASQGRTTEIELSAEVGYLDTDFTIDEKLDKQLVDADLSNSRAITVVCWLKWRFLPPFRL